jgi:hypothetical protein
MSASTTSNNLRALNAKTAAGQSGGRLVCAGPNQLPSDDIAPSSLRRHGGGGFDYNCLATFRPKPLP